MINLNLIMYYLHQLSGRRYADTGGFYVQFALTIWHNYLFMLVLKKDANITRFLAVLRHLRLLTYFDGLF